MEIRELQKNLKWSVPYGKTFNARPGVWKHVEHCLFHVLKSIGRLSDWTERKHHEGVKKMGKPTWDTGDIANMVICAARMANILGFDLELAIKAQQEKANKKPGT